jgi:hypothetical protein
MSTDALCPWRWLETLITTYKTTRRHYGEDHNRYSVLIIFGFICTFVINSSLLCSKSRLFEIKNTNFVDKPYVSFLTSCSIRRTCVTLCIHAFILTSCLFRHSTGTSLAPAEGGWSRRNTHELVTPYKTLGFQKYLQSLKRQKEML